MSNIVTITEAAAFQIKEMMKQNEEEGSFLRVAIKGGGCSGYPMEWHLSMKLEKRINNWNSLILKY